MSTTYLSDNPVNSPNFLQLFYYILFRPNKAFVAIEQYYELYPHKIFTYSAIALMLAALGHAAYQQDLQALWLNPLLWFALVSFIGVFSWLFRSNINNSYLFAACAFAQLPFVFLGIAYLWKVSHLDTNLIYLAIQVWSFVLFTFALKHSLNLDRSRFFFIILSPIFLIISLIILSIFTIIGLLVSFAQ